MIRKGWTDVPCLSCFSYMITFKCRRFDLRCNWPPALWVLGHWTASAYPPWPRVPSVDPASAPDTWSGDIGTTFGEVNRSLPGKKDSRQRKQHELKVLRPGTLKFLTAGGAREPGNTGGWRAILLGGAWKVFLRPWTSSWELWFSPVSGGEPGKMLKQEMRWLVKFYF